MQIFVGGRRGAVEDSLEDTFRRPIHSARRKGSRDVAHVDREESRESAGGAAGGRSSLE